MKFLVLIGVWLMCIELFHVQGKGSNGITLKVMQHQTAPKDIVEGNSITFFCDDSSVHPVRHSVFDASFYRNDIQIHDLQKPDIYVFGRYLTIRKMEKEDSGTYKCAFNTNEGEKLTSGSYVLNVGDHFKTTISDVSRNTRDKRNSDMINTMLQFKRWNKALNKTGINIGF